MLQYNVSKYCKPDNQTLRARRGERESMGFVHCEAVLENIVSGAYT